MGQRQACRSCANLPQVCYSEHDEPLHTIFVGEDNEQRHWKARP
jgi:hypothetical protein